MKAEPHFVYFPYDDEELVDAHRKAKSTLPAFHAAVRKSPRVDCRVKIHFPKPDGSEGSHIWLAVIDCLEELLFCTPRELPTDFVGLAIGESLVITDERIEDWMVLDHDGSAFGGYSLRLFRDRLPDAQRDEFDRYVGVSRWSDSPHEKMG